MEHVFHINSDRESRKGSSSTGHGSSLRGCKDCDELVCWTCDNEGCKNQDKQPPDPETCDSRRDLFPKCKDCDEWQCITCDNEK